MSKLYGYLTNDRGSVATKAALSNITANVQTVGHRLSVTLWADGRFSVLVLEGSPGTGWYHSRELLRGNVADAHREAS